MGCAGRSHVVRTRMKTAFEAVLSADKCSRCISTVTGRLKAVNIFKFHVMFHLWRLKCFESTYLYLNMSTERSVWLGQSHRANPRQSWTPGTSSIVDVETCCLLTYLHMTSFAFPALPPASCQFAAQVVISVILYSSENTVKNSSLSVGNQEFFHSP